MSRGDFEIKDIPTTVPYQFVIRKPGKELMPPWEDIWASSPIKFVRSADHQFAGSQGEAGRLEIIIQRPGITDREALRVARSTPLTETPFIHRQAEGEESAISPEHMSARNLTLILRNPSQITADPPPAGAEPDACRSDR